MELKMWIFYVMLLASLGNWVFADYCTQSYTCTKTCSTLTRGEKECGLFGWGFMPSWGHCTTYSTEYRACPDTCYKRTCCPGYTGSTCSTPLCHGSRHCSNGGTCEAPDRCSCLSGFTQPLCDDINECYGGSNDCQDECVNTYGSYHCMCRDGYELGVDQRSCYDANECQDSNGGCSQICTNTEGSYKCTCRIGFTLGPDGKSCVDIDDCKNNTCQHNGTCVDGINSFTCMCDPGYTDQLCQTDVDECQDKNGGCHDICTNTNGSYECICGADKIPHENGVSCIEDDAESQSMLHNVLLVIILVLVVIGISVGIVYLVSIKRMETFNRREKGLLADMEADDLSPEVNDGLIVWDVSECTKKYGSSYEEQ